MDLIIHDLTQEQWEKISGDFTEPVVISDNGKIHPCIGCFCCWNKTPGECIVHDGYENMGALIHHADQVVVISRYSWGGFSGFVKNVFDRCLGYVLPQFELTKGESHHQKRYDEDKPFTFIFYGHDLTDAQKASAERYVRAVCTNIRGHVKDVIFRETDVEASAPASASDPTASGSRIVLLNGSMRNVTGNSAKFAKRMAGQLNGDPEIIDLKRWYPDNLSGLVSELEDADVVVLCLPLYVDGLPSQVIRLMERFAAEYRGAPKKIYLLANMGLYESSQLVNLFEAVRQWSADMGFDYCGGLGISAGELLGVLSDHLPFSVGPTKNVAAGMRRLAEAINNGSRLEDIFAEPHHFPRSLFIRIANNNWNTTAKQNGLAPEDLYRQL